MNSIFHSAPKRKKVALLINTLAPARLKIYSLLADHFDLLLLHGGKEGNRDVWGDLEKALPNVRVIRAWGWQFRMAKKVDNQLFDEKFIHVTPGFAWHLLKFEPDAVISNEMGFRSVVALIYGSLFRKPVWIWSGGTPHSERNISRARRALRKVMVPWARHWITYGRSATDYLLGLGVGRDRILQSQNCVDETGFRNGARAAWDIGPRPVVLYAGQFIARKGVGALLEAAARVQQSGLEFSLLLVGSGRDQRDLRDRARAIGLKNIHFQAAQPPEKIASVYRSADLLVFPTLEDVWGLVANEAMLSGLPVLCSRYAGCAAELFPEECIFAPDDLDEFAAKLARGVTGALPRPDISRLKSSDNLAREIAQDLNNHLARKHADRSNADRRVAPSNELAN